MNLWRVRKRLAACALAFALAGLCGSGAVEAASAIAIGPSGLPLPRFVSLKADRVNMHVGPGKNYDVRWVYTRTGLPVEITAEFENWRRIRDSQGAEGWVYHSLLSGQRTGMVMAKDKSELVPLRNQPDGKSQVVARLQAGVVSKVEQCTGSWCRIFGEKFEGWIEQDRLWGVYPNEKID
jgi:SH3-like domain-containing protein